ncbi:MAG: lipocalin-like domain-containing protein [Planctomycetota bacterium]|jgi:hypothetical protein
MLVKGIALPIALLSLAMVTGCAQARSEARAESAEHNPFVGAWRLAHWTAVAGDGTTTYPYGEQAQGQIVYTSSGQMSAQLMRPSADVTRFADLDGVSALEELGLTTFFAYWGTYEVDETAETITHHLEGSLAPAWVGTAQVRGYRFENRGRLILTAQLGDAQDGTAAHELVWERVR